MVKLLAKNDFILDFQTILIKFNGPRDNNKIRISLFSLEIYILFQRTFYLYGFVKCSKGFSSKAIGTC